jgi:hypothetical protein
MARGVANDDVTRTLRNRLSQGRRLRARQTQSVPSVAGASHDFGVDLPAARARRALFRVENAADGTRDSKIADVRRLLAEEAAPAYTRYVAQRTGAVPGGGMEHVFAFAFDRAARDGSAAALRLLMEHAQGADRYVAQAAETLLTGGKTFVLPHAVDDLDESAPLRRLGTVTDSIEKALRTGHSDRATFRRLLNDFAAIELSAS